jgi:glycosyltransferase involved in cell wall biosynthesis
MGYRGGFAPRILPCLFSPSIVTFHEFDNFSYKGRIGTMPLGLCADRVIFSSSFEREAFLHCYPWKRENSKVIPIGSNIPAVKNDRKDFNHIIFFGLIMPGKGLEDFLSLVAISENKRCGFYFSIVGKVPEKFERYYKDLREGASGLPIAWVQNLTPEETARTISQAAFCYLPYPDGVSERRGSLLALLKNGVFVVTKRGKQTLDLFTSMLEIGDDPEVALNLFIKYRYSPHLADPFVKNGFVYAGTRTWEFIAQEHRSLYSSTVR